MDTIASVKASAGFAIVLDGVGGTRGAFDFDEPFWRSEVEPAVIVLNSASPRAVAWFIENNGLAPADRDAVLGPVRRTWAAAFDVAGERAAALILDAPPAALDPEAGAVRVLATRTRVFVLGDLTGPTPMLDRAR
jgi:hypothetical protein